MFQIRYGLGGGFGGCGDWEDTDAKNYAQAEDMAYEKACEDYESYVGLHGLRTLEEIMEEEDVDEEVAQEESDQERESWINFEVREI